MSNNIMKVTCQVDISFYIFRYIYVYPILYNSYYLADLNLLYTIKQYIKITVFNLFALTY